MALIQALYRGFCTAIEQAERALIAALWGAGFALLLAIAGLTVGYVLGVVMHLLGWAGAYANGTDWPGVIGLAVGAVTGAVIGFRQGWRVASRS